MKTTIRMDYGLRMINVHILVTAYSKVIRAQLCLTWELKGLSSKALESVFKTTIGPKTTYYVEYLLGTRY